MARRVGTLKLVQKRGVSRGPLNLGLYFQQNNTLYWNLQQFREALPGDHPYRFVIHDRDSIFSADVDRSLTDLGVQVLLTPVRAPKANGVCERLGGSLRRECLDFLIPFNERHLRMTIRD